MISMQSLAPVLLIATLASAPQSDETPAPAQPGVAPRSADSDAPLPAGFPPATAPGNIEVKKYPVYRSAVARGQGMTSDSSDFLFWPLFRHISTRGVAMTAPVISNYESNQMVGQPGSRGQVSMEFPYNDPALGQTGQGVGNVQVVDHEPGDYLALGMQGRVSDKDMKEGLDKLVAWLDQNKSKWTQAGPPRRLGYHGPMTPADERLWEIQIPVKPVSPATP